jgi:hypothetical protein
LSVALPRGLVGFVKKYAPSARVIRIGVWFLALAQLWIWLAVAEERKVLVPMVQPEPLVSLRVDVVLPRVESRPFWQSLHQATEALVAGHNTQLFTPHDKRTLREAVASLPTSGLVTMADYSRLSAALQPLTPRQRRQIIWRAYSPETAPAAPPGPAPRSAAQPAEKRR